MCRNRKSRKQEILIRLHVSKVTLYSAKSASIENYRVLIEQYPRCEVLIARLDIFGEDPHLL